MIPIATRSDASVSFDEADTRSEEMYSVIETWIDELVYAVDDAWGSEVFQE